MNNSSVIFWKWFAIVLVILNLVLLSFIVFKPRRNGHRMPLGQMNEGPARFIIEQLRFNKDQEAAFIALKQAHRDSIENIQRQGRELRHSFFEGLKQDSTLSSTTENLAKQIAANQERIELVTYKHFEAVKKLCDPKQKQVFNEIIQEVLMRMAPHPGPPRPGERPPPDHP
jgi:protein CpxP